MKHIKKFNESNENGSKDIQISMADLENINHNLAGSYDNVLANILRNWGWKEDQMLLASPSYYNKPVNYNGSELVICDLFTTGGRYKNYLGYAISINGEVKHIISIYEPHGCEFLIHKDLFLAYGHEDIILLELDTNKFNRFHTR